MTLGRFQDPDGREVDLHLHSTASDGTLPPAEVVRRAAAKGLWGMSLTDHDTVDGLGEAAVEAERLGIVFIAGAELSANEPGRSVHLLAFGFDPANDRFGRYLAHFRTDRLRRARGIVERLRAIGVPLDYAAVARNAGTAAPTRAHVSRALVAEGLAANDEEVFRRWLSADGPAYVEKMTMPPARICEEVHAAGGVVVLAHPGRYHRADEIRRWVADGMDGIEVLHPVNTVEVRRGMDALAAELGLLRSGGSDWHGPGTRRRSEIGSQSVPAIWLERIAERTAVELRR